MVLRHVPVTTRLAPSQTHAETPQPALLSQHSDATTRFKHSPSPHTPSPHNQTKPHRRSRAENSRQPWAHTHSHTQPVLQGRVPATPTPAAAQARRAPRAPRAPRACVLSSAVLGRHWLDPPPHARDTSASRGPAPRRPREREAPPLNKATRCAGAYSPLPGPFHRHRPEAPTHLQAGIRRRARALRAALGVIAARVPARGPAPTPALGTRCAARTRKGRLALPRAPLVAVLIKSRICFRVLRPFLDPFNQTQPPQHPHLHVPVRGLLAPTPSPLPLELRGVWGARLTHGP